MLHLILSKTWCLLFMSVPDMFVYSQFPALEDFCLVVCHVCDQVVTPQGILTHYGKTPQGTLTPQGTVSNMLMHTHADILINAVISVYPRRVFLKHSLPANYPPNKQTALDYAL